MQAAVASGADAVYFGVDAFNARQRAENFRLQDLPEVMQWLHQRGVKGFLTLTCWCSAMNWRQRLSC